jgi:iron(III) transport system ATP-binding protein
MISLQNISKSFDNNNVLKDISLDIKQGETVALLGQSGSGKSTLLNIIAGFEHQDTGTFEYFGQTIFDDSNYVEPEKRNIGFVFQDYALFPHLTVGENIAFGMNSKDTKIKENKIKKLLSLVHLPNIIDQYPSSLSGGQQQRVAIARVLARESELILFDEPFSSIDVLLKQTLLEQIKLIIKENNKTAIFVTHDPREAIILADKIAFMEDGKIIQYASAKELHAHPKSKSVENIFGTDSFMFQSLSQLIN